MLAHVRVIAGSPGERAGVGSQALDWGREGGFDV